MKCTLVRLRRDLLRRAAAVLLMAVASPAIGAEKKGDADQGKGGEADKAVKPAAKKSEGAVLTVVVTGDGVPIAQAEVKVTFPAGGDSKQTTGASGEATFKSAAAGTVKVRVIATGWESDLKTVELKEGAQKFTFALKPLPGAGDAEKKRAAAAKASGPGK